jgi:hypothetical protein
MASNSWYWLEITVKHVILVASSSFSAKILNLEDISLIRVLNSFMMISSSAFNTVSASTSLFDGGGVCGGDRVKIFKWDNTHVSCRVL